MKHRKLLIESGHWIHDFLMWVNCSRVRLSLSFLPTLLFPDTLLSASSSGLYSIPEASAMAPLAVKQNITLPPLGLEHLRNCKYLVSLINPVSYRTCISITGKSDNSAGIFPEIERAFFTVENRLYLWNYMER